MKKILIILLAGITLSIASPAIVWNKLYNGFWSDNDPIEGKDAIGDEEGNVYVIGTRFDDGYSTNDMDIEFIKYGINGDSIWEVNYNTDNICEGRGIDIQNNQYIYIGGIISEASNASYTNIFVAKYDKSGNQIWTNNYGLENNAEVGMDIVTDDSYEYIVGGREPNNILLLKIDVNGNKIWEKVYPQNAIGKGIAMDGEYLYLVGGDVYTDFLILKVEKSNGDTVWTSSFDAGADEEAEGVVVNNGYVYVVGYDDSDNLVLAKFDASNGDNIWVKKYSNAAGYGIDAVYKYIYVTGIFLKADENNGNEQIITIKYDEQGNVVWEEKYATGYIDAAYGIDEKKGYVYITGYHEKTGEKQLRTIKYADDKEMHVITPNGGEEWEAGTDQSITWEYTGPISNVTIEYSADAGSSWNVIVASTENDGFYIWTVPDDTTDRALVRITDVNNTNIKDVSDDYFKITEGNSKSITVLQPNGGENLKIGSVYTIKWDYTGQIDSVVIEYISEQTNWIRDTIAIVENTSSYDWTVPDTPGDSTLIYIFDNDDYYNIWDLSDTYFKISKEGGVAEEHNSEFTLKYSMNDKVISYSTGNRDAELYIYRIDGSAVMRVPLHSRQGSVKLKAPLPSGIYFIVLKTEGRIIEEKITIIK